MSSFLIQFLEKASQPETLHKIRMEVLGEVSQVTEEDEEINDEIFSDTK